MRAVRIILYSTAVSVLLFGGIFILLSALFFIPLVGERSSPLVMSDGATLPVDPGSSISFGGGFNDPFYPGNKPHKGVDLNFGSNYRTEGKPVYAAFSGRVITSGIGDGCKKGAAGDNTVTIVTPAGFKIGYMHMDGSDILVSVGDTVTAGEKIGAIGGCGEATGPHLHFEVSPGTDKESWLVWIPSVRKFGENWLDPVAFMAHYGIKL